MLIIGIDPGISGSICFFDNGKIITPELDDMYPFLDEEMLMTIRNLALNI